MSCNLLYSPERTDWMHFTSSSSMMEIFQYWISKMISTMTWWRCSFYVKAVLSLTCLVSVKICVGIFDEVLWYECIFHQSFNQPHTHTHTYHQTSHLLHLHHFYINLGNGRKVKRDLHENTHYDDEMMLSPPPVRFFFFATSYRVEKDDNNNKK